LRTVEMSTVRSAIVFHFADDRRMAEKINAWDWKKRVAQKTLGQQAEPAGVIESPAAGRK